MTLRLFSCIASVVILIHACASNAQEPLIPAGIDITVVQAPTPDNREAVLDFTAWMEPECEQDVLMISGSFQIQTSVTARRVIEDLCLLIAPGGEEHCLFGPP